jgi:hypothetical protein
MSFQYIPDIGASGIFVLQEPYSALLKPNTTYTVQAVRRLKDVIAEGENPFEIYYDPYNVPRSSYELDILNEVCVVSLQSGSGEWVYVPTSFIISFPIMNGVKYTAMMIGISLGAIPDTMNLSAFKTKVFNMVRDTFGITTVIKEIAVSAPVVLSKEQSDLVETARANRIVSTLSDAGKLKVAEQDLLRCREQLAMLEKYIIDNQT